MRFTLSLHDYIDQYTINKQQQDTHCPVCYHEVMQHNTREDMSHILECYKEQLLLDMLRVYKTKHGELPGDHLLHMVDTVQNRVRTEMIKYCESHQF